MSELTVTYSDLRLQPSSQPQGRQRLATSERKSSLHCKHQDLCTPSPWKFIAVIPWIICLMLTWSVGILATMLNQKSCQGKGYPGNLFSNKEANKTFQIQSYPTCSNNCHQHGENCYYFSRDIHPWEKCNHYCIGLESSFLKLNMEEEMNFVIKLSKMQCGLFQAKFWISLYYNNEQLKWVWLDGTDVTLHKLQIQGLENANNKCVHIKFGQVIAEDCQNNGYCICKKIIYSD
ncbi:C-type lectin domain family 1 member A-like isoform X1 [Lontra canadensis]|uniref:C-type lectin domain family 1 member A-like isoform X1 n=1 Tax=Lontra canadensis TaxID=76717 RepID=UPI0013F34277|nr:C-type lectin domain family 1 member A-like isoform X1 [Lontra canadensis]